MWTDTKLTIIIAIASMIHKCFAENNQFVSSDKFIL